MNLLEHFFAYAQDFEKTYADDDWSRLEKYFAPDAEYEVQKVSFACHIQGRDSVLAGIRRSVDGFDRKCKRDLGFNGEPYVEGDRVVLPWKGSYTYGDAPPLAISAVQTADYRDGLIFKLTDHYDDDVADRYNDWLAAHGQGLDPGYADR